MSMDLLQRLALAKAARVDPPKYDPETGEEEPRVRIRVTCPDTTQQVVCGHIVRRGTAVYECYASEVAAFEGLVDMATDDERAQVTRDFEAHSAGKGDKRTCQPSWAASYRRVLYRDPLPFTAVEVVEAAGKAKRKTAAGE